MPVIPGLTEDLSQGCNHQGRHAFTVLCSRMHMHLWVRLRQGLRHASLESLGLSHMVICALEA